MPGRTQLEHASTPAATGPSPHRPAGLTWWRAAAAMGVSVYELRQLVAAGTSPAYARGPYTQSQPRFGREDVVAWRNDPVGYQLVRAQRMADLAANGTTGPTPRTR